jgi:hypothetical protein
MSSPPRFLVATGSIFSAAVPVGTLGRRRFSGQGQGSSSGRAPGETGKQGWRNGGGGAPAQASVCARVEEMVATVDRGLLSPPVGEGGGWGI